MKHLLASIALATAAALAVPSPVMADDDVPSCINPNFDPESPELWLAWWYPTTVAVADERGSVDGLRLYIRTNHCRDFGPFDVRPADPGETTEWLGGYAAILGELSPLTADFAANLLASQYLYFAGDTEYDSGE